jgi:hypothetical protein
MPVYLCPNCEKNWQGNYCPECEMTIEGDPREPRDDGAYPETFASCPAMIRLNPVRYLIYNSDFHMAIYIWVTAAIPAGAAVYYRSVTAMSIFGILLLLASYLIKVIISRNHNVFRNGDLVPAMIVSTKPLEFITITCMDAGSDANAYAVKRLAVMQLPGHRKAIGTLFPCAALYKPGEDPSIWCDYHPQPLCFGTGNKDLLENRMKKIGPTRVRQLEYVYKSGQFPAKADELFWLHGEDLPQ